MPQSKSPAIPPFYDHEKIALFIDGPNLYSTAKAIDADMDYRRLLEWCAAQGRLTRACYYTILMDDQEYKPLKPLTDWLDYNGYKMVTKPGRDYIDDNGRKRVKGDMDVELTVDMMELADHVDHILLFSGDGDFRRLIEAVQKKGARVTVVSTMQTQTPMIADELRRQADHFLDLVDLIDLVEDEIDLNRSPLMKNKVA